MWYLYGAWLAPQDMPDAVVKAREKRTGWS